jgi:hypothetical protein
MTWLYIACNSVMYRLLSSGMQLEKLCLVAEEQWFLSFYILIFWAPWSFKKINLTIVKSRTLLFLKKRVSAVIYILVLY